MTSIICDGCNGIFKALYARIGLEVNCPYCNRRIVIGEENIFRLRSAK